MSDDDEVYDEARAERLRQLLRRIAEAIRVLDQRGILLSASSELLGLLGEARSELFHYEVRSTYDTPEIAEHRRLVEDALRTSFTIDDPEDEEPWRRPPPKD
jgi:PAS domain S-box-containing protein